MSHNVRSIRSKNALNVYLFMQKFAQEISDSLVHAFCMRKKSEFTLCMKLFISLGFLKIIQVSD